MNINEIGEIVRTVLLIVSLGGIMVVFYKMIEALHRLTPTPCLPKITKSLKEPTEYHRKLQLLIIELKGLVRARKIWVGRFHNGGSYFNGLAMLKFSAFIDTPSENCTIQSAMDNFKEMLTTRYPFTFPQLLIDKELFYADINDCRDINFKNDFKKLGTGSVGLFLITQLNDMEEGFVVVDYGHSYIMTDEEKMLIRNELSLIRAYLNMVLPDVK
jgi:hypothetical protein